MSEEMSPSLTIVAGSGPSLACIEPERLVATDRFVRVNNFFFEREFYLGRRVDLAFIDGDARISPFVFATLKEARKFYDISAWTTRRKIVERAGLRICRSIRQEPMAVPAGKLGADLQDIMDRFDVRPTSGTAALIHAYASGARRIGLAGIDLYAGETRYHTSAGRHMRDLLGPAVDAPGPDQWVHNPDLDRFMIDRLAAEEACQIYTMSKDSPLAAFLDIAPIRDGERPDTAGSSGITDWVSWAGLYPIGLLKLMRSARAFERRVLGRPARPFR